VFDIGFSEIVVIAVVALIVIGPEKLPKTARTLGHLFGRLQRYVSDVKADINREMELDELRKLQTQVQSAAREVETSFDSATREMETGVRNVEKQLSDEPGGAAVPAGGTASSPTPLTTPPDAPAASPAAASPAAPSAAADAARQASLPGFDRG
jgi:sec-independent protein translocase protein TatB